MGFVLSAYPGTYVAAIPTIDEAPCPRVEVLVGDIPAGVASTTLYRLAAGREYKVRGAVRSPVLGALSRVDFEIPFGVPVTYRAEFFDAAGGSVGFVSSAPVTLNVTDTWMHNPLDPAGAVKVFPMDTAGQSISRPIPGQVSRPLGRRVGVVLTRPRQGVTGLVFDLDTETFAEADKVQAMVGGYDRDMPPVLCIRKGAEVRMRIPNPLFLGVLDISEEDVGVKFGREDTIQRLTGDEVAPPVPGLFVPLLRRKDVDAYYKTRNAADADNLTRLDLDRRYELAGVANA